jgi:hypothetical protein
MPLYKIKNNPERTESLSVKDMQLTFGCVMAADRGKKSEEEFLYS